MAKNNRNIIQFIQNIQLMIQLIDLSENRCLKSILPKNKLITTKNQRNK